MKRILLTFGLCLLTAGMSFGQSAGDIAFVGFNADGDDDFAIVALVDISANTTIYFTDNEPNAAGDGFLDFNEGSLTWDTGGSLISAGTVITFTDTDSDGNANFGASVGTLTTSSFDAGMNLSGSGDALYAVIGSPDGDNITAWLAGAQNASGNEGANFSATGLTDGTDFVDISGGSGTPDGGEYDRSTTSGSKSDLLAEINDSANWTLEASNGENLLPFTTTSFTVSSSSIPDLTISGTEGWRMLSTPTSDNTYDDLLGDIWTQGIGTGADVTNGTASVQLYNTTTDNFAAATDLGATMTTGVGFITYVYSDDDYTNSGADAGFPKTLSLSGTENSGSVSPTLNTEGDAFTLVGNPYASTIDWDLLTRSDVTGTVYVYDNTVSSPGYISWNGSTGDLTDGLIATYQGFWVQNTSGSPTPSLTIEEADQSSGGTFRKEVAPATIQLTATMGELSKNAHFSFTNTGELGKDNYDGLYLEPLDFKDYMAVSMAVDAERMSINNLPADLQAEVTVPLSVEAFKTTEEGWTPKAGEITLSWPELNNLPENWEITLTDYQTGITTNILTQNSYTFTAEEVKGKVKPKTMFSVLSPVSMTKAKSADDASRFGITIAPNTSVSNEPDTKPTAFALNQNYPNPFNPSTTISYSVGQTGPVNITVYNVMGQKVAELVNATKTAGNNYQVSWDATAQASGIYYYRLTAPGQVLTRQMTLIK